MSCGSLGVCEGSLRSVVKGEGGRRPADRGDRYEGRRKGLGWGLARRAGGSVISSRLKHGATPEDSSLIHTVVLQARTSLPGDMKHTHTRAHMLGTQ